MTTSTTTVAITELLRDPSYQVRKKLDGGTVEKYARAYRAGTSLPPVQVAVVKGVPIVVDGWHRLAALESIGARQVDITTTEATTASQARWLAAEANLTHGLPLKRSELREVFKAYVRAGKHLTTVAGKKSLKSYREIGRELGCTHPTIRTWMHKDFRHIARHYSNEENAKVTGGHREMKPEDAYLNTAREGLQVAKVAAQGVTNPTDRADLIELAEALLAALKEGGRWEPQDF